MNSNIINYTKIDVLDLLIEHFYRKNKCYPTILKTNNLIRDKYMFTYTNISDVLLYYGYWSSITECDHKTLLDFNNDYTGIELE